MNKKQHLDEKQPTLHQEPEPPATEGTAVIAPPPPAGATHTAPRKDHPSWDLTGATVVGHADVSSIKDTNKSLGAPRALMNVPAARPHA